MHYNIIVYIVILLYPCDIFLNRASSSTRRADYDEVKWFLTPAAYDVESSVLLGDETSNRTDVGYRIEASLIVEPEWSAVGPDAHHEYLLKFHLQSPKLYLRVKHNEYLPYNSMWDTHADSTFYAHWKNGVVNKAYLEPTEEAEILNYKLSLISLFQVQAFDGEYVETDISGKCNVLYESTSETSFQKIKRQCYVEAIESEDEDDDTAGEVEEMEMSRTKYSLSAALDALEAVSAHEVRRLGPRGAALRVRAAQRLRRAGPPAAGAPVAGARHDLEAALRELPAGLAPLDLAPRPEEDPADDETLEAVVEAHGAALESEEAGAGGGAGGAAAAARALPLAAAAPAGRLRALLAAAAPRALAGLARVLALAGSRAAHAAADAHLALAGAAPLPAAARAYLAAAALAPRAHAALPAALLRLADAAREPRAAAAALLSGAAAARARPRPSAAARDHIMRSLARCKDDECRTLRLHALGNLRRDDTAEALLEHAERGPREPALAALGALAAAPRALAGPAHAPRRARLRALAAAPGRALDVRAAALDLLLRHTADLRALAAAAAAWPAELRRVLWQRVLQRAAAEPAARAALRAGPALAARGTSAALARDTGWAALGWRASLDSLQVAAAGLLRRGSVRLLAHSPAGDVFDELTVEVWTRGLESIAGVSEEATADLEEGSEGAADGPSGGIELAVGGARMPGLRLFDGQAELLGHVWAGAGSSPTPVLRALRPLFVRRARRPLVTGAWLRWRGAGVAALALDASAQVSLWSRSARGSLELRAGTALDVRALVAVAGSRLRASATASAEPRLRLAADLDFYDAVALCVRVHLDDVPYARAADTAWSAGGAGGARAPRGGRAGRSARSTAPGRTLSLGADNDVTCRTLVGADAE